MAKTRKAVVDLANSWIGRKESNGSHKYIIDIYNGYTKKLPRGIQMQYDWAWCACTWSAIAIKLGYTDIMPIEISCGHLIEAAKKMGCWVENDSYIASLGDAILYDWDDTGTGDNKGWPEHVGVIVEVNKKDGYFIVVEGNYNNSVKKRKIAINGKYIRGFITPKYDKEVVITPPKKTVPTPTIKKVTATASASNIDKKLAGAYKTTAALYCRTDAGSNKKILCLIPKGTIVRCYGYYSISNNVKWLYIQFTLDGIQYTGFSSSSYLKR